MTWYWIARGFFCITWDNHSNSFLYMLKFFNCSKPHLVDMHNTFQMLLGVVAITLVLAIISSNIISALFFFFSLLYFGDSNYTQGGMNVFQRSHIRSPFLFIPLMKVSYFLDYPSSSDLTQLCRLSVCSDMSPELLQNIFISVALSILGFPLSSLCA